MAKKKYFGYFADRDYGDGKRGVLLSTDLDDLKKMIAEGGSAAVEDDSEGTEPANLDKGMAREMDRALKLGLAHNHLIGVATHIRRSYPTVFVKNQIVKRAAIEKDRVDIVNDTKVFGLTEEDFQQVQHEAELLGHVIQGVNALPGAALMSLVATFDALIADIVKKMLRMRPERYASSDKQVPVRDILAVRSTDEFIDLIVEEDVYTFLRGSHEEQVRFIEKNLHVPIIAHWRHWPDFIEVFERRNLVAHGEETFTARYVATCETAGYDPQDKIGQNISLSAKYLRSASDILLEFSILLTFVLWRKHFSETEEMSFDRLNQTVFELVVHERYTVARDILEFALTLKAPKMSELVRRMMVVNLASAHRHLGDIDRANEVLDGVDWSASAANFRICVAALKGDVDSVADALPTVAKDRSIRKEEFRRWPVFDFVRNETRFQKVFEDTFGEPISRSSATEAAEPPETETGSEPT